MPDKKDFVKLIFFVTAALILTAFNTWVVLVKNPTPILAFVTGGITFITWGALLEVVAAYLEEFQYRKR